MMLNMLCKLCDDSTILISDINDVTFFNGLTHSEVPYSEDLFEMIDDYMDGMFESINKMVVGFGKVAKVDIDLYNAMLDDGDAEAQLIDVFEAYDDVINHYYTKCKPNCLYVISKEVDASEGVHCEYYSLSRLVKGE